MEARMTVRTLRPYLALFLATALAGCGDDPAPPPSTPPPARTGGPMTVAPAATPAEATRARLTAFFDVVKAGNPAAGAPFVVYRGPDEARNWKDLVNYANEDEKERADGLFTETRKLMQRGAPRFVTFRSEKESEGQWLVWQVAFGEGPGAKTVDFAWLEVKGTLALGDID
jgi:hypothetical protein